MAADRPAHAQFRPSTRSSEGMSISSILARWARETPTAAALHAPARTSLKFSALLDETASIASVLRWHGVSRNDRIAMALPFGPELAVAFLGVATTCTAAPLNPQYTAPEFEFYLRDLEAKAVIVQAGVPSAIRDVAKMLGVMLIEIEPRPDREAGRIAFASDSAADPSLELPEANDTALILHTSGTTSRPKIILLSHANLCASAANIVATLALTRDDICLDAMPLFHIHGLVAGLLAPLAAGGSTICGPRFSGIEFYRWLSEFHPTWYTAVPAMHQEVLAHAAANQAAIATHRLRFIRSSSASLPPKVMADLENTFSVPVIEAYGMTEAAHQMASNPLPPRKRKFGSVGLPAGPEIQIVDEAGQAMAPGETGEIAIRGANVSLLGRPGTPERKSGDWFRTGDLGHFDAEGYLFVSGRLKEVINRGGEKISPREVDEVLLEHPDVAQAVACAVPDDRLGEDIVAVVVRRAESTIHERELRAFVADRLAPFKVPRRVVFVDQIPKGATGKIQRIGLAGRLGIDPIAAARPASQSVSPPTTPTEVVIAQMFGEAVKLDAIAKTDNFFELGGDSLAGASVLVRIQDRFGVVIDGRELAFGTLEQVAAACDRAVAARAPAGTSEARSGRSADVLPLWRRARRQARSSLVTATRGVARALPIEKYPGWFGTLHDFKVPANVSRREFQGPGGGSNSSVVLELLGSALAIEGDVAECGVWKGQTLLPMGLLLKQRGLRRKIFGFDTFEGLGTAAGAALDMAGADDERKHSGGFSDASFTGLLTKLDRYGLSRHVQLVQGYFDETLQTQSDRRFCFVHMDCVLHDSYKSCLEFFYPRMNPGGIILLDEYRDPTWPGATQAVDDFLAGRPEFIEDIRRNNQIKFFFRKM